MTDARREREFLFERRAHTEVVGTVPLSRDCDAKVDERLSGTPVGPRREALPRVTVVPVSMTPVSSLRAGAGRRFEGLKVSLRESWLACLTSLKKVLGMTAAAWIRAADGSEDRRDAHFVAGGKVIKGR